MSKPKKLSQRKLASGKKEFHQFKIDGKITAPCICGHNFDFTRGCIAKTNPYILSAQDVISGEFLKDKDTTFSRLDKVYHDCLENKLKPAGLNPHIIWTNEFPEQLKQRIWSMLEEQVDYYKGEYGVEKRAKHFNKFIQPKLFPGVRDGRLNGCKYCYSFYKNDDWYLTTVEMDFTPLINQIKQISKNKEWEIGEKGEEKRIIRFGKNSEVAHIFNLPELKRLFEVCSEYKIIFNLPTKFLFFDETIANHLKESKSILSYSVSNDKLEKGAVFYGFDTASRLARTQEYADRGVMTMLRMALDCTESFDENEKNGGQLKLMLEFLDKNKNHPYIKKQLIPLRHYTSSAAKAVTGKSVDSLLKPERDLFHDGNWVPRYTKMRENSRTLVPNYMHKDFLDYFGSDMCAEIAGTFYCNSCQHEGMRKDWKLDNKNLVKIEMERTTKRRQGKAYKTRNSQKYLFSQ
jgi:hypothetical protein